MTTAIFADSVSFPMITISEVLQHIYCARFTYYMHCLNIPQREGRRYKVKKGREVHHRREQLNRDYLRQRLHCVDRAISVCLSSRKLRITGITDELLSLDDGTLAPLDYKYTVSPEIIFKTHKIQSVLFAKLIRLNYDKPVHRGFLCYVRSGAEIKEIIYTDTDFIEAEKVIHEIFDVIENNYYPDKTAFINRCSDCCYRNICLEI